MELTPAVVTLPLRLDPVTVSVLVRDLEIALASPAPVVVLRGASAETFCLGLAIDAADQGTDATREFAALLVTLHRAPKPLLAAVDGAAIGGGFGLVCACDWVVAAERATFGLPELVWGLLPAMIWPLVADRMAPHVARQWTLGAYARPAGDALSAGAVDEMVPAGRLDAAVRRGVRTLARLEPAALPRLRAWIRDSRRLPLADAIAEGAAITSGLMTDAAVHRRWRAFAEGESPWSA
ncbi:MAG: enoyl-CoA hydratase-related protein [Vicinamibacterales bacterium]